MTTIHPDCQMPDGAEPCAGFNELRAKHEEWVAQACKMEAERDNWKRGCEAADAALQAISLTLGGSDEWSDQDTMISDLKRQAEEAAQTRRSLERTREDVRILLDILRYHETATEPLDEEDAAVVAEVERQYSSDYQKLKDVALEALKAAP